MFTWICPQCGREVPPAYNDCPDCAETAEAGARSAACRPSQSLRRRLHPWRRRLSHQYAPPQQQPQYAPPPPQYAPPPAQTHQYAPPPQYQQPPQHRGLNLPVWLMTILFAMAIAGVVFGVFGFFQQSRFGRQRSHAIATVESPAAKPGTKTNSLQKYIEVSGVRFVQDAKKKTTMAKFVLINHSEADINGLAGNVTIWGRTQKSEEDAQGTFSFTTNLGPMETQELTVPLKTKRKIYELPDWQNITTDVQITAPPA